MELVKRLLHSTITIVFFVNKSVLYLRDWMSCNYPGLLPYTIDHGVYQIKNIVYSHPGNYSHNTDFMGLALNPFSIKIGENPFHIGQ